LVYSLLIPDQPATNNSGRRYEDKAKPAIGIVAAVHRNIEHINQSGSKILGTNTLEVTINVLAL
jgi:hypothetical protein